jgi:hypothetical protein
MDIVMMLCYKEKSPEHSHHNNAAHFQFVLNQKKQESGKRDVAQNTLPSSL